MSTGSAQGRARPPRARPPAERPLAVFGPQTGYFSPQILMEQDVHAPAAAGSETLTALRTKLGLVVGRAEVDGEPVLYTRLRSTYEHELDSALDQQAVEVVGHQPR